ncbi:MAG: hypothetical protein FWH11_11290 [Micrococcales bacterium]|nr:hypothetical protein [Micrococcales bacterium]
MPPNPRLDEAVAIFKELGWADAAYADVPTLPLGTPAQKKAALAGLRTGEWSAVPTSARHGAWRWATYFDVDAVMLWLFAIRLGVGAKRAAGIVCQATGRPQPGRYPSNKLSDSDEAAAFEDTLFAVMVERGAAFAQTFVRHGSERCPDVAVRLVAHYQLEVPDHRDYLDSWRAKVLACVGEPVWRQYETVRPEVVRDRFVDHVRVAFASGRGADILQAALAGAERGWVDRDTMVDLVLSAMDAAPGAGRSDQFNPAQRWLKVWLEDLHATDGEIVARGESLVPVLAGGDPYLIECLAPVLIAGVDDELLADVATAALTAPTKKALRPVLKALAARPRPSDATCDVVGPQVVALDTGRDGSLVRAVRTVVDRWGLEPVVDAEPVVQGLWQPTPPVWQVPRFDRGEQTPEALTQLAAELAGRGWSQVCDVVVERFLVVANAVARRDPALARAALSGARDTSGAGVGWVRSWAAGELADSRSRCPLEARDIAVFHRLGEVPCLLSEPSTVDLRITPVDLLGRLGEYQDAGVGASEADLFLALTRLRLDAADDLRARFDDISIPVLLGSGEPMKVAAGPAVSRYLADPIVEPETDGLITPVARGWAQGPPRPDDRALAWSPPASLRRFPQRLGPRERRMEVLPGWGDATGWADWLETQALDQGSSVGVLLRQVAQRGTPFSSHTTLSFLAAQHDPHPDAASDVALALDEAWQRGLLRPGAADTQADWDGSRTLPAMARTLADIARLGMLSVVWPVLDDLLVRATSGPRVAVGAADIAGVVADLLPEVRHAVATGLAEPTALDLPGVRALTARVGSSQAVSIAREVVSGLPAPVEPAPRVAATGPRFEEIWPEGAGALPALVDDVKIAASWLGPGQLRVDMMLPDHPDVQFQVVKKCHDGVGYRDLLNEGQCKARQCQPDGSEAQTAPVPRLDDSSFAGPSHPADMSAGHAPGTTTRGDITAAFGRRAVPGGKRNDYWWLFWDDQTERLTASEHRNREAGDSSRPRTAAPPLSTSLVTVALLLAVQDGTDQRCCLVVDLVEKNLIGSAAVRIATAALLDLPEIDPTTLVRVLERHPEALPTLWPLLTEPVRVAGASGGPLPRWLNRVLDITTFHADHLCEAARRGLIPADAARWPGLEGLAARRGRSAAVTKARALLAVLGAADA